MAPRRSTRLHPQIRISKDGAGMAPRRSPRLHPQIQASEVGARLTCRRRRGTSPASLPDDDDMLREILLRLPPQPSSLPRASAVCKRWRDLVTDPKFLRSFRAHHRKPPLLGGFVCGDEEFVFTPVLDTPNRIPPARFSLGRCSSREDYDVLDCRHGLVLVKEWAREEVVLCVPITGEQHHVAILSELRRGVLGGAVLCASSDLGHVHGGCHSDPFNLVLVSMYRNDSRFRARVYSSETGVWGNLILTIAPCEFFYAGAPTLVGSALYWLSSRDGILEFDFDRQSLAVIAGPPVTIDLSPANFRIIQCEDGGVGFAILALPLFQTWQRNVDGHGVSTWVPWKTIEVHVILGLPSLTEEPRVQLVGYDEDNGTIFLYVDAGVYMVQLMSMHSRKLFETHDMYNYHPFTSFFAPGMDISGSRYIG